MCGVGYSYHLAVLDGAWQCWVLVLVVVVGRDHKLVDASLRDLVEAEDIDARLRVLTKIGVDFGHRALTARAAHVVLLVQAGRVGKAHRGEQLVLGGAPVLVDEGGKVRVLHHVLLEGEMRLALLARGLRLVRLELTLRRPERRVDGLLGLLVRRNLLARRHLFGEARNGIQRVVLLRNQLHEGRGGQHNRQDSHSIRGVTRCSRCEEEKVCQNTLEYTYNTH